MAAILVVPIRLDALCLERETGVTEALADFSLLPYVDPVTGIDVRPDAPYLSEQILPVPFQDQGLRLPAGVHLHWSLPDALTRIEQVDGVSEIPVVPNRWLVTRTADERVEAQWVVESDYLAPPGDDGDGITFPVPGPVSFRRLGRRVPYSQWSPALPGDRLPGLTAIGHGEPTFAAFYPNCHSVFGLHDDAITGTPAAGVSYDVLGWYADPADDVLAGTTAQTWRDRLAGLDWDVPENAAEPVATVCYARLVFAPDGDTVNPLLTGEAPAVYVGNTATEALAAHLGSVIPGLTADEVENLVEALAFADELEAKPLDVGVKLAEARHANGFRAVPSGVIWTVRRDDRGATAEQRQARAALDVPAGIGDLLNALNGAQDAYDRAREDLASLRERLFADWYKYQLCLYPDEGVLDTYPDPDEVRAYLEDRMAELAAVTEATGVYPPPLAGPDLAGRLLAAREAIDAALAAFNAATANPLAAAFVLERVAAPQFYLPAEPVVLLTGPAATPSDRYGADGADTASGLLACQVADGDTGHPAALRQAVAAFGLGTHTWAHQPWHPVLLQWEVEFYPAGDNLDPSHRDYGTDFVTANYTLAAGDVDLRPASGRYIPDRDANAYGGTTVLTPGAAPVLSARVLRYLAGTILAEYTAATGIEATPDAFLSSPDSVLDWYAGSGTDERLKTLVTVYRHLNEHELANLSQVLGGFNDALLMRRLTRQLPVADPLGFPEYQEFAARVAAAAGDETAHAPQPLSDFNPVRAGALRVRRLRIVGNFGIGFDVDTDSVATTTPLRVPDRPDWAAMPPRLVQPARLSLRWLDAAHDLREMNDVPATSPVCGWIVPDDLDTGLAFYDADGLPLGRLDTVAPAGDTGLARWEPAPGGTALDDIANAHLRAVAAWLRGRGPDRIAALVGDLDTVLDEIEPEDYGSSPLAVRPLAVLRAELDLSIQGLPAVQQDWNVFRQDMLRDSRETNDFGLVRFPVRVGGREQLDDGVAGYWTEDAHGELGELELITAEPSLEVAVDAPPTYLTLLADPRAPVNVTSGMLPAKAVRLPPEQYRDTMTGLRTAFFTAPVLTGPGEPGLPLPDEPGRVWSWRGLGPTGWTDVTVTASAADESLPADATLREGWLTLTPAPETDT